MKIEIDVAEFAAQLKAGKGTFEPEIIKKNQTHIPKKRLNWN